MRVALYFLITLLAAPAWADWMLVEDDGDVAIYIDPATTQKNDQFRRVLAVQDLKEKGKDGEMSRRILMEYDCKEQRSRTLSTSFHSEPMAGGKTLLSNDYYTRWTTLVSGTDSSVPLRYVCAQ